MLHGKRISGYLKLSMINATRQEAFAAAGDFTARLRMIGWNVDEVELELEVINEVEAPDGDAA